MVVQKRLKTFSVTIFAPRETLNLKMGQDVFESKITNIFHANAPDRKYVRLELADGRTILFEDLPYMVEGEIVEASPIIQDHGPIIKRI